MYQAAIEGILGLRRSGATFALDPCIPAMWTTYSIEWKVGSTHYTITITNAEHQCRGVSAVEVDGVQVDPAAIPLLDDGQHHQVGVTLGRPMTPVHAGTAATREGR
jgi:cellobiose phosphorylase